jgi:uncharacterized protein YajQ (UPF0234 family)
VDQAAREYAQRFDFKGTGTTVELAGGTAIVLRSSTEDRVLAATEVLKEKLVRRKVPLRVLQGGEPRASGRETVATFTLSRGINQDKAREIGGSIKRLGLKVQHQVMGDKLRVSGKNRDDLQKVIAHLREADFGIALQFENYR